MRKQRTTQIVGWVLIGVLLLAVQPLSRRVDYDRTVLGMSSPTPLTRIVEFDPTAVTGVMMTAALGGFRGIAATMMWTKMEELWDSGKGTWLACLSVMRSVTLLDPHWLEPWKILGWHLAYNLYVETDDPALKAQYLSKGINALREGVSWNPNSYELYMELAWTYFDRVRDYEEAIKWFQAAIQFPHPDYIERMIAHAYERLPDLDRALDWYNYALKRNPADGTAAGATITIRERYLPAWRLMQQGEYDGALRAVDEYLEVEPNALIALHVKAHIFEQAGRPREALETWRLAARLSALNHFARRKVDQLSDQLGIEVPPEERAPSYILEQMRPSTRLEVPHRQVPR